MTTQNEAPRDSLMTVNELATYLKVDRKTIYRLPIKFVRVGKFRRYLPEDIDAYLNRD